MLTKRPDRAPNLTISNIRIGPENECAIYYNLAHNKTNPDREEHWEIPHNSTFDPNIEMEEGGSYAVWTEEIDVPYTTSTGKKRNKKRYDWCWVEQLDLYERDAAAAQMSESGRKLKRKKVSDQFQKVESEISILKNLFDGF